MSGPTGLRRFAVPSRAARAGAAAGGAGPDGAATEERCEMCGERVPERHGHLVDTEQRSIGCACTACALLFTRPGGRYRTIPDRVCYDPDAPLTDAEWAGLAIPVGIAFFFVNSALGHVVASYPSPAGATECKLDLDSWERLTGGHPMLGSAEPDVEAILIAKNDNGVESFIVPIDACYELAGRMRLLWRGFDGGTEARQAIAAFLGSVRSRVRALDQEG